MDADARSAREALGRIRVGGSGGEAVATTVLGFRVAAGDVQPVTSGRLPDGGAPDDSREGTPCIAALATGLSPMRWSSREGGARMVT